jgi:lambda family phage portal protein
MAKTSISEARAAVAALAPSPAIPGVDSFSTAPAKAAGFMDSTAGGEPKLAWARSSAALGFGYGSNGFYAITNGGRTARESSLASNVANELSTSNPIIATLLLNLTTQAIGTGLTLSSKPCAEAIGITPDEARALSHAIETRWQAWAANPKECDYTGRFDLHQMAACFFRHAFLNGEAIATLEWKGFPGTQTRTKVNLLDVTQLDRLVTRTGDGMNILSGVAFTPEGRLAGYMLRPAQMGSFQAAPAAQFVAASTSWGRTRVIHALDYIDPRQIRGLSPLVSALTPAQEETTLAEFTLGKALIETSFAMTIESALPTRVALDGLQVNDHLGNTESWLTDRQEFYSTAKVTPQVGTISHLHPGDSLKMNKSETPNNNFDSFDKSLIRKAAKAAGAAVEDVSGDYSQTSFSASRLATALPHEINLKRRKDIAERFYSEVFAAWLEEAFETHAIELPRNAKPFWQAKAAYCEAKFLGKGRVSPDEKKTAEADILMIENNLLTLTDALAARGIDLETQIETIKAERKMLADAGLSFPGMVSTREDVTSAVEELDEPPARPATRRAARNAKRVAYPIRLEPYEEKPRELSDEEILG